MNETILNRRIYPIILAVFILSLKLMIIYTPSPTLPPEECTYPPESGGFPSGCGFVFDEAHYVPAARRLMMGEAVNNEHPPLAKFLIVAGILIFGDNPLGWRIFSVISFSISVALIAYLAWELTRRRIVMYLAPLLFGMDVMSFNIGQIAMLDSPALVFLLAGTLLFLKERYIPAAVLLALASLSKTATLFAVAGLLFFKFVQEYNRRRSLREAYISWTRIFERMAIVGIAISLAGMAAYDYAYGAFATPFEHLDYMLNYHSQLKYRCNEFNLPFNCVVREVKSEQVVTTIVDLPMSWTLPIFSFQPAAYHVVTVSDGVDEWHPIAYWGIYSPLWWTTWIAILAMGYQLFEGIRLRRDVKLEAFTLSWIIFNYGIYFILGYIMTRWVYTFYFILTLPAIAIAIPYILADKGFPRTVLYALTIAQITWFFIFFPVKSDLHIAILKPLNLPR